MHTVNKKIFFVTTRTIASYNNLQDNSLLHVPIKSLFNDLNIKTSYITLQECLQNNIPSTIHIISNLYKYNTYSDLKICFSNLITNDIADAIKNNKLKLLLFDTSGLRINYTGSRPLQYAITFLKDMGIQFNQCTIITNNYTSDAIYQLCKWEYFECCVYLIFKSQNININHNKKSICYNSNSHHRFLCLNSKPRFHRYLLMYKFLKTCTYFDRQFNYSLKQITIGELAKNLYRYQRHIFKDYHNTVQLVKMWPLLKHLPSHIHGEKKLTDPHLWSQISTLESVIYKTGIDIVTETSLNDNGRIFLTEKTFRPIAAKMPYIICGQYGCLNQLRLLGYKTYNKFWDESYDDEIEPEKRIEKIVNIVVKLSNMSNTDFNKLLKSTGEITQYNFNHFLNTRIPQEILKIINCHMVNKG